MFAKPVVAVGIVIACLCAIGCGRQAETPDAKAQTHPSAQVEIGKQPPVPLKANSSTGMEVDSKGPEHQSDPTFSKEAEKPIVKEPERNEIWMNDTWKLWKNDFDFPGVQGSLELGMTKRGGDALKSLLQQVKTAQDSAQKAIPMQRMEYIFKAFVCESKFVEFRGKLLDPMLDALEQGNNDEFNRLANFVNATILIRSAMELGMDRDDINKMSDIAKRIYEMKNAAEQKDFVDQMQKVYRAFIAKSTGEGVKKGTGKKE